MQRLFPFLFLFFIGGFVPFFQGISSDLQEMITSSVEVERSGLEREENNLEPIEIYAEEPFLLLGVEEFPSPEPTPDLRNLCSPSDLSLAQSRAAAASGSAGPATYTATGANVRATLSDHHALLIGGDGVFKITVSSVSSAPVFNSAVRITLPLGFSFVSTSEGMVLLTETSEPNDFGQTVQTVTIGNLDPLGKSQEFLVTVKVPNGTEVADDPETEGVDEGDLRNLKLGQVVTGTFEVGASSSPGGEPSFGSASSFSSTIAGMRVEAFVPVGTILTGAEEGGNFGTRFVVRNNPVYPSDTAFSLRYVLPKEIKVLEDSIQGSPAINLQNRTFTWNLGILSPSHYSSPHSIGFTGYIPFRESFFTELGDSCDGDIIDHFREFSSSYSASARYHNEKTVFIYDEEIGDLVDTETEEIPITTAESRKKKHVAVHMEFTPSASIQTVYNSAGLHVSDMLTGSFGVLTSPYYEALQLYIDTTIPDGIEFISSTEVPTGQNNATYMYEDLPDVEAGTSLTVLETESELQERYDDETQVVGNDDFSIGNTFTALASSVVPNDPVEFTIAYADPDSVTAEYPNWDIRIDRSSNNDTPLTNFSGNEENFWYQVGEIVHVDIQYTSTESMPSKNQFLELFIPPELEFIVDSDTYNNTGNFDEASSSLYSGVGTPEEPLVTDEKLTWFLGDATTNNIPPEWHVKLQFRVKDVPSVQDGSIANILLRRSGWQSQNGGGGVYSHRIVQPIQLRNPIIETVKVLVDQQDNVIDTDEEFLALDPEDVLTTQVTLTNTSEERTLSSVAYNLELQDAVLPIFRDIGNLSIQSEISSKPQLSYEEESHTITSTPFDLASQESIIFSYTGKFEDLDFNQTYQSVVSASHRTLENSTGFERVWEKTSALSDLWTDVFSFTTPDPSLRLETSKPFTEEGVLEDQYLEEEVKHTVTIEFPIAVKKTLPNPVLELRFPHEGIFIDELQVTNDKLQIKENDAQSISFSNVGNSILRLELEDIVLDGKSGAETTSDYRQVLHVPLVFTGVDSSENSLSLSHITPTATLSWEGGNMQSETLNQPVVYQIKPEKRGGGGSHKYDPEKRFLFIAENKESINSLPVHLQIGTEGVYQFRIREYNPEIHVSEADAPWSQWYDSDAFEFGRSDINGFDQITVPWEGGEQKWKDGVYTLTAQYKEYNSLRILPDVSVDTVIFDTTPPVISYQEKGGSSTETLNQQIEITVEDELSSIESIEYRVDNGIWVSIDNGQWIIDNAENNLGSIVMASLEIENGEGEDVFMEYRATDSAGNVSTNASQFIENKELDHSASGILSINNDAKYTGSKYVTLNSPLHRTDIVTFRVKTIAHLEDGFTQESGWSREFPYTTEHLFELPELKGIKTVVVEYETDDGELFTVEDTIIYSDEFGVEYSWINENDRVYTPASQQSFSLSFQNLGYTPWSNTGSNPVRLVYRLKNLRGEVLEEFGDRVSLSPEFTEYSQTSTASVTVAVPDIHLEQEFNEYILEFDLVEGDSGYFSEKNIAPLQIPFTVSGERENLNELVLDALGGVGGIQPGYALLELGSWIVHNGEITHETFWSRPEVPANTWFSHYYYLRNIGKKSWKSTDQWVQSWVTDIEVTPRNVNTTVLENDELEIFFTSLSPNRPGTRQSILLDLVSGSGEELITGGLVNMTMKITENCTPKNQLFCKNGEVYQKDSCSQTEVFQKPCSYSCIENGDDAYCDDGTVQITNVKNSNAEVLIVGESWTIAGANFGGYDWENSKLFLNGDRVDDSYIKAWRDNIIRFYAREKYFSGSDSFTLKVLRDDGQWDIFTGKVEGDGCKPKAQTVCFANSIYFMDSCGEMGKKISSCDTDDFEVCTSTSFGGITQSSCVYNGPKFTGVSSDTVRNEEYISIYGNFLDLVEPKPSVISLHNPESNTTTSVEVLSWESAEVRVQIPEILSQGDYEISAIGVKESTSIFLESDWCAELETPKNYTLTLKPGEKYQINTRWRNVCSNTWDRGTRVFGDPGSIRVQSNSTTGEQHTGESIDRNVVIMAPSSPGIYNTQLFLQDPKNRLVNTKGTEAVIQLNITVDSEISPEEEPQITTCPTVTAMGDRLVIRGKNFSPGSGSTYTNRGNVSIGGIVHEGKWIEKWEDEVIAVKVQSSVGEGYRPVTLHLQNGRTSSNQCETYIQAAKPKLKLSSPYETAPGSVLTLRGENFGSTVGVVYLEINGTTYRHDARNNTILAWKEDVIEIAVQDHIELGSGEVNIKRQDGDISNAKPVEIVANENCTLSVSQDGVPLYQHPYASTVADKGLVKVLSYDDILKPVEWGLDHRTNTKWVHVISGTYQGWIEVDQLSPACPINTDEITNASLSSSWVKVLRGELEYVSTNKEIRLVKYKNSFPPIYTPNGTVYEGERMYVIKTEGEWAQVMTDEGKVGWIDKTYLNIDPSPYIGMMLFPLAGDDENKILATQEYGWSEYALAGLYDGGKHQGIDLVPLFVPFDSAQETEAGQGCNAPVFAARSGTVSKICEDGVSDSELCQDNGNLIFIDHGDGLQSSYAHLNSIVPNIKEGTGVDDRTLIGYTGNTGKIFGDTNICHLDFGVWQDGESQNPYRYFRAEGRYLTEAEREELALGEIDNECGGEFSDVTEEQQGILDKAIAQRFIDPPKESKGCRFNPDQKLNRAISAKILSLGIGIDTYEKESIIPYYDDVGQYKSDSPWYYEYVYGLSEAGVVNKPEYGPSNFSPDAQLTYGEISKILTLGVLKKYNIGIEFDDSTQCFDHNLSGDVYKNHWSHTYIGLLAGEGIFNDHWWVENPDYIVEKIDMVDIILKVIEDEEGILEAYGECFGEELGECKMEREAIYATEDSGLFSKQNRYTPEWEDSHVHKWGEYCVADYKENNLEIRQSDGLIVYDYENASIFSIGQDLESRLIWKRYVENNDLTTFDLNNLKGTIQDCKDFRQGSIVFSDYEKKCGTLLEANIINLDNTDIVRRSNWGAIVSEEDVTSEIYNYFLIGNNEGKSLSDMLDTIVIHHTAEPQYQSITELDEKEKSVYGWMPYHFIINGSGETYEGRPLEFKGDHVAGKNTGKVGIALMGDFEDRVQNLWLEDEPTESQLNVLKELSLEITKEFYINTENIGGHKDYKDTTECPGDNLEHKIHEVVEYVETSLSQ